MKGVFLLLGPEEGEKRRHLQKYLRQAGSTYKEAPEVHRFYAFQTEMIDVVSLLRNLSLFARFKVAIVYNAEAIQKQQEVDRLLDYCSHPAEDTALFLLSNQVRLGRLEKAVEPKQRIIFWEMFENKKLDWVRTFFRRRRISIDPDAAAFLLEMVQNNTRELDQECSRLAFFFGEGARLTVDTLASYIYHSKEENVFTLFESVAARDLESSQEKLAKILLSRESDPVGLLNGILWQVRKLHSSKLLFEANHAPREVFAKLKVRSKKAQRVYLEANRRYSRDEVEGLILLLTDFSIRLRTTRTELHRLLLQLFLYYAIVHGTGPPRFTSFDALV
jgi:DNA polymerase-3 subunit delta